MLESPITDVPVQDCGALAAAVYSLMDHGRYDACAALFTDDAVWVRGGKPVAGRAAIRAALDQRPEGMVSRHLVTNVTVMPGADDTATATACFVPLRGTRRDDGTVAMPPVGSVGDLFFEFRKGDGGWRISRLEPKMVFTS